MNYKEFQKRQQKVLTESKILPGDPKKFGRKHHPINYSKFWEFISEMSNIISIFAVIAMFAFRNTPWVPMVLSLITLISFYTRFKMNKCPVYLPGIWAFNTAVWSLLTFIKI